MKNHIQNTCNPYSAMRKIGLMQTQVCVKTPETENFLCPLDLRAFTYTLRLLLLPVPITAQSAIRHFTHLFCCFCFSDKTPGLAARFFQQADILYHHTPVYRLAHVINRQCGYARGRQCLHLNPGFPIAPQRRFHQHTRRRLGFKLNCYRVYRQRMTHGNQFKRTFCRHYARDTRARENISFRKLPLANHGKCFRPHGDFCLRYRYAGCDWLLPNINHMRISFRIQMRQLHVLHLPYLVYLTRNLVWYLFYQRKHEYTIGLGQYRIIQKNDLRVSFASRCGTVSRQ